MESVEIHNALSPGTRARVEQTIQYRDRICQSAVEGTVLHHHREATGSWFAHGKGDKFWLDTIRLQKDDGEITKIVLDRNTRVVILDDKK